MNNTMKDFINSMGLVVELWTIIFKQFLAHGFAKEEALEYADRLTKIVLAFGFDNGMKEESK